ncbi:MAG: amidohydrolase family protein, partial [Spirochaetia bacterium]
MSGVLLKNCFHIQPSAGEEGVSGADILIEGETISRIGRALTAPGGTRVIDCAHHVVVPGFVNTHHHFFQTLTRNLPGAQNAKLFDWLVYLYEIWKNIDEEAIYYSSLLAMGE